MNLNVPHKLTDEQIRFIEDMIENHENPGYESSKTLQYILTRGFYFEDEREFLNNERKWFLETNDWPLKTKWNSTFLKN